MSLLLSLILLLVAAGGLFVVISREPRRQVFALAANGLALGVLFFILEAPDVALAELVVGTVATPLLFLVTLAAIRTRRARERK